MGVQGQLYVSSPSPLMLNDIVTSSSMFASQNDAAKSEEFRVEDFVTMVVQANDDKPNLNPIDSRVTLDKKSEVRYLKRFPFPKINNLKRDIVAEMLTCVFQSQRIIA
jgi:hypothetical protein